MNARTKIKSLKNLTLPKLRPYQQQVVSDLYRLIKAGHQRCLIVAATGSGKTIIAAQIVYDAVLQGKRVLFVVHREVLIGQTP